jgi:hypothetical protein
VQILPKSLLFSTLLQTDAYENGKWIIFSAIVIERLKDIEIDPELFFSSIANLEDKILVLLIQLPHSMGIVEGMNGLRDIIPELDKRFRYTGSSSLEEMKPITLTLFIQSDS